MKLQRIVKEAEKEYYDITLDVNPFFELHLKRKKQKQPMARLFVMPHYVDLLVTASLKKIAETQIKVEVEQSENETILLFPIFGKPGPVCEMHIEQKLSEKEVNDILDKAWPDFEKEAVKQKQIFYDITLQDRVSSCDYLLHHEIRNYILNIMNDAAKYGVKSLGDFHNIWGDFENRAPLIKNIVTYKKWHPLHTLVVGYLRLSNRKRLDRFLRSYIVWSILVNTAEFKSETLKEEAEFLKSKNDPVSERIENLSLFYNELFVISSRSRNQMKRLIDKVQRISAPVGLSEYGSNVDEIVDKLMNRLKSYTIRTTKYTQKGLNDF